MSTSSVRRVIAIIPARGGSKGIPGKNVRHVGGKPLIAHSILAAQAVPDIAGIYVTTDDAAIANEARRWGAQVIERPAALASDSATSESALAHALDTLAAQRVADPDLVIFLQPTSPLRDRDDLVRALRTLESEDADSLFSACEAEGFMWRVGPEGPRPMNYDPTARPMRQAKPRDVIENGSFYIFKPSVLRAHNSRLGGRIAVHLMPQRTSFQIDTPFDLELVEWLFTQAPASAVAATPVERTTAYFHTIGRLAATVATSLSETIVAASACLVECIASGNKILACGNGGRSAVAQPFGHFANDNGRRGDVLLAISTGGNSPNVLDAARVARAAGMRVVSLIGSGDDALAELSDHCIRIPSNDTQCIQELHMAVLHVLCQSLDERIVG